MNYIYDIYLNLNEIAYDFFDWYKTDKIVHIKKTPLIKVSTNTLMKIINSKFRIDNIALEHIKNKTEIYKNKTPLTISLFTDSNSIIAVKFDNKGISIKKSFLLVDEELDVLEYTNKFKEKNLKINVIGKDKQHLKTRFDIYKDNFIKGELKKINNDRLNYIYFECFNRKEKNKEKLIKKIKSIKKNSKNYKTLYNILKLTSTSKNT